MTEERRYNTRNRNRRRGNAVNPAFYVGYCEDIETPEMIMKKFEELEKVQEANKKRQEEMERAKRAKRANKKSSKEEISDSENENDSDNDGSSDENKDNNNNNNNNDNNGLSEADLVKVFQQTSMFSVSSVLHNNEILHERPIISNDGFIMGYEDTILNCDLAEAADFDIFNEFANNPNYDSDENYYDFDGNESDFFEDVIKGGNKFSKRRKTGGGSSGASKRGQGRYYQPRGAGGNLGENCDDYTQSGMRDKGGNGKKKEGNKRKCHEINYCKIPPFPLPRSWAHRIQSFDTKLNKLVISNNINNRYNMDLAMKNYIAYKYHIHDNLVNLNVKDDLHNKKFVAILIDCPFDLSDSVASPTPGIISVEQYRALPINSLVDNGFLFVWTPSELIYEVCSIAEEWGFTFADHACWVKKLKNNKLALQNGQFIRKTKENLLLFRKAKTCKKMGEVNANNTNFDIKDYAGKIELRHQRTSDVHFNFIRYDRKYCKQEVKPREWAYKLVETLLPATTAHIEEAKGKGDENALSNLESNMLYLWAPENEVREGWTMMVDNQHLNFLKKREKQKD